MTKPIPNLWPADLTGNFELRSPVAILREQANFWGEKTRHLIDGQVITRTIKDDQLSHFFYLVAPKLDHYKFHLLTVEQHGANFYPLKIFPQVEKHYLPVAANPAEYLQVGSEEEFINNLATLFASEETKKIIHNLLAQSQEDSFSTV